MFYEASLLSKTGPLARVWLASNLDRKLTKQNVMQANLETNVKDIIGENQAPLALRLSGQLLLGVVKIYNRKAKYLMDDCSDALIKIKMAFRPGNVDLPTDPSQKSNPNALILPDTITELDLFAPLPDPEDLLREPETRAPGQDPTLLDFGMSQIMDNQTPTRPTQKRAMQLVDDDLGLDFGLEPTEALERATPMSDGPSIEQGRRAPTPRRDEPTMLEDDDLGLDFGLNDSTLQPTTELPDQPILGGYGDLEMGGMDDDEVAQANAAALARASAAAIERQRDSASPLSSVRSSVERDLERTFQLHQAAMGEDEDPTALRAAQRVKRRKVVRMDLTTEISNQRIKDMQENRTAILKAPSFLPRDPLLLQLMELQRNGRFVSNLMGDGRLQGWAPELRGILSLEVVRRAGDKKRKRDSGIADVETDGERHESLQLEIPPDDDETLQAGAGAGDFDTTAHDDAPLVMDDQHQDDIDQQDEDEAYDAGVNFDVTEAPILHPAQSGAVALGTKKMVHMLREYFAPDHSKSSKEPPTPSKRVKNSALFTDLCPEERTTRDDATKMFFELLVLGTKDAIKVEQDSKSLGLPIRVRGKRGLWGDWAELGSGGEIASQAQDAPVEAGAEA